MWQAMANEISIPTLVVVCVLGGLVFKYLFWPSNSSSSASGSGSRGSALSQQRQREQAVERIQQMFPQVERRTILWDLQRNGGSIAATTEKILSGTIQPVSVQCLVTKPSFAAVAAIAGVIEQERLETKAHVCY